MRPNGEELVRGAQSALMTYVLPYVTEDYARHELTLAIALLGLAAGEWDGAVQRLVDENASFRAFAARSAEALASAGYEELATELRTLSQGRDESLRCSDLAASNERLRGAIARLAVVLQGSDDPALRDLRPDLLGLLREDVESRARSLLGPRSDG